MPPKPHKIFVLDTNVILHDSSCIYKFKQCDVVIPISVLEELDKFKKGNETLNMHARDFLRTLDSISTDTIFNGGVRIAPDKGRIVIKLDSKFHRDLALSFTSEYPDHKILNVAYILAKKHPSKTIVLVTKDVNLRMKAKAVGLLAEDYKSDHVTDISSLYKGYRFEENVSRDLIDKIYTAPFEVDRKALKTRKKFLPNEYVVMRNGKKSGLGVISSDGALIRRVEKLSACGIKPRNVEQAFALNGLLNPEIKLVTISGRAGTGKTLLALAAALESRSIYSQIFLARPVVPLSNKDIGYLPGNIHDKLDPYMQPLYDNLGVVQHETSPGAGNKKKTKRMLEDEQLVIAPLAYIRGRSLVDVYFIVDEAQNLTPHEIKTIITRAGEGTKMVFTGDIFQIDHPYLNTYSNGLSYLIDKMQGQKIYTHINLEKGERSELSDLASNIL